MATNHQFPVSERVNGSEIVRDWTRFPPDSSEVCLVVNNAPRLATICDESYGGIGLIMAEVDVADIQLGAEVTVLHYGHPTRGLVQWTKRDDEPKFVRLGIQWVGHSSGRAANPG
jgi:hypothetical protein